MLKDMQMRRPLLVAVTLAFFLLLPFAPTVWATARDTSPPPTHSWRLVGPKPYYLALGDSLAFGIQPNGDYDHGYVADLFQDLQHQGVQAMANMACAGETSVTFLNGHCPSSQLRKYPYTRSQLDAAVAFLHAHPGQISPVTLDLGANDLMPDIHPSNCTVSANFDADLATLDTHLTQTILPQLRTALTVNGKVTGDLVMMNYYDPYQNLCPNSLSSIQKLNQHLAKDVRGVGLLVDVFGAFGGAKTPNKPLCTFTWICSGYHDIHSTDKGYRVIAQTFEQALKKE